MPQGADLIGLHMAVIVIAVDLGQVERQGMFRPGIVAAYAFHPRGKTPVLGALAAGGVGIGNGERAAGSPWRNQFGVGLFLVPGVRITAPLAAVEMQHLGFNTPGRFRPRRVQRQRKRFDQDRILGKVHRAAEHRAFDRFGLLVDSNRAGIGHPQPALGRGMIGPAFSIDGERQYTGGRPMLGHRGKNPAFAQPGGEAVRRLLYIVAYQGVDRAIVVIQQQQFALGILGKTDDPHRGLHHFAARADLVAVDRHAPNPPRFPIAKDIHAFQVGKLLAAVHEAAGDRSAFSMGNFHGGRHNGCWTALPFGMYHLVAFGQAPAEVVALAHPVDQLP